MLKAIHFVPVLVSTIRDINIVFQLIEQVIIANYYVLTEYY